MQMSLNNSELNLVSFIIHKPRCSNLEEICINYLSSLKRITMCSIYISVYEIFMNLAAKRETFQLTYLLAILSGHLTLEQHRSLVEIGS